MSNLIDKIKKECENSKSKIKCICKNYYTLTYHFDENLYKKSITTIYNRHNKDGIKYPFNKRTIIIIEIDKLPSDIINYIILPYIISFKLSVIYYYIIKQYNVKQYLNPDSDIIQLIKMFSITLGLKKYESDFLKELFFN